MRNKLNSKIVCYIMFILIVLLTIINIYLSYNINKQLESQSTKTSQILNTISDWELDAE